MLLAPFALAGIPWLVAKMLNACLLFGAVVLFLQTLKGYLPEGRALILAVLFGLYPPFWRELHLLLTETFSYFLMCAFVCLFCALHRATSRVPLLIVGAAASLAMLALTRVVFGYIILAALLLAAGGFVLARAKAPLRRSVAVFTLALLFCAPYLLYTQRLTGEWFYWSLGFLSPVIAGAAMAMSSVSVVTNSLSLRAGSRRFRSIRRHLAHRDHAVMREEAVPMGGLQSTQGQAPASLVAQVARARSPSIARPDRNGSLGFG